LLTTFPWRGIQADDGEDDEQGGVEDICDSQGDTNYRQQRRHATQQSRTANQHTVTIQKQAV